MRNRPGQDPDDDTVEFDPITEDEDDGIEVIGGDGEPEGWQVLGGRAADGWVCIEIIPLGEGEPGPDAEGAPRGATSPDGR
jgi:hypothetical protein